MINVALDVHVRNSYLKASSPSGRMRAGGRVPNTLMDLSRELAAVEREAHASGEPVRAVMEATTNSRAMVQLLERYGQQAGLDLTVDVLDPRPRIHTSCG